MKEEMYKEALCIIIKSELEALNLQMKKANYSVGQERSMQKNSSLTRACN
jgi:hypothetical protein